jgi:hypothetical protein
MKQGWGVSRIQSENKSWNKVEMVGCINTWEMDGWRIDAAVR